MDATNASIARPAAALAIIASVYFLAAAIATHIVSTQYDPIRDYISDYAVGPYGWIYGSAFLASFVGSVALSVALWTGVTPPARSRAGAGLLGVVGVTYAVDFVFPTDILAPGQPPQTITGVIHLADAALGWILFVVAAFMIAHRLKLDWAWRRWQPTLSALTWLSLALLVALVSATALRQPIGGLLEKSFILVRNIWALTMATAVLRSTAPAPRAATAALRLG